MSSATNSACTFATNVWEKTYRTYLMPGYVSRLIAMHQFAFAERLIVINNVADRQAAVVLADRLVAAHEIDRYTFVEDEIASALAVTGMPRSRMGSLPHYTTFNLVALYATQTPYLLYHDAEVEIVDPGDYLSDGIRQLGYNPNISSVCPNDVNAPVETSEHHGKAFAYFGQYALDYGFSDHMYLVRRTLLTEPFYQRIHPASLRYPTAQTAPIFEQMMDSYHRLYHRVRFTDRRFHMRHVVQEGASHPAMSPLKYVRYRLDQRRAYRGLQASYADGLQRAHELLAPSRAHDPFQQEFQQIAAQQRDV